MPDLPRDTAEPNTSVPTPPTQAPHDIGALPPPVIITDHKWQPVPIIPPPVDPLNPPVGLDPPPVAPSVIDRPYVQQEGDVVTSTMGNWNNEPTSYAYQWQRDGSDAGTGTATYPVVADDVGHTLTCIVTAINAGGIASATSNGVVVITPAMQGV